MHCLNNFLFYTISFDTQIVERNNSEFNKKQKFEKFQSAKLKNKQNAITLSAPK